MALTHKQHTLIYVIILITALLAPMLLFRPAEYFDASVVVVDDTTQKPLTTGHPALILTLNGEKRRAALDSNGRAVFQGLPTAAFGSMVTYTLDAAGYSLANSPVKLDKDELTLRASALRVTLSGQVQDTHQQPIAGAMVDLEDLHAKTDENGWYTLEVPVHLLGTGHWLRVNAVGYQPYKISALAESKPQVLLLQKE